MSTITFNTLQASRNLKAAGFDEAQADAVVDTLADAFSDTVATKADIAILKADIAELKADMLKVAIGLAVAIIAANASLTFAIVRLALPLP